MRVRICAVASARRRSRCRSRVTSSARMSSAATSGRAVRSSPTTSQTRWLPSDRRSRRSTPSRGPRVPSATSASRRAAAWRVVGVHDRQEATWQGRAGGQAEQPLAGEEGAVHAVGGAQHERLGRVPHDRLVAGLRLAQQLLGAPQLGDVADEAGELAAPVVHHRHGDQLDDQGRAVAADGGQLEPLVEHRALARRDVPQDAVAVRPCVRGRDEQLAEVAADGLLARPAEQHLGRRVELHDAAPLVDGDDGVQGGPDDGGATVGGRVLPLGRVGHGHPGRQRADGRVVAHAPTVDTACRGGMSVAERSSERLGQEADVP